MVVAMEVLLGVGLYAFLLLCLMTVLRYVVKVAVKDALREYEAERNEASRRRSTG